MCHLRLTKNPNDEATNAALALTYFQAGDEEQAQYYFARTAALRENYNPPTVLNYRRVIEILQERGIQAVCVQYPMRNVGDLKNMLSGYENIIFVDNEKVFKAALSEGKYWEYFEDQFAGDFGHCTPQGNRLLAENVAAVLGKTCFKTLIPVGD